MPIKTISEYKNRKKRLHAFERYLPEGYSTTQVQMVKNNLKRKPKFTPTRYNKRILEDKRP